MPMIEEQKLEETKQDIQIKIFATVLNDLSPAKSVTEWEEYIRENGHDAKTFFGGNGQGYEEYLHFINVNDKHKLKGGLN